MPPLKKNFKKNLKYVELVSSISAKSAGKATRDNINEYLTNTESAIKQLTKIDNTKVILNINPTTPPVNMMNSLFFETSQPLNKKNYLLLKNQLKKINQKIKFYIPEYNAILLKLLIRKFLE